MGANSAVLAVLCLATVTSAIIPYSDQPRFESRNGHLLVVGAAGANISLLTSQGGQVNINDENVLRLLEMARNAAQKVDKWENEGTGGFSDTRSVDTFLTPLTRRLEIVEMLIANGSSSFVPRRNPIAVIRQVQRLNVRVVRLAKDLKSLRDLVEANECASGPCLHGGTCQDMFNNFFCVCPDQWEGNLCQKDVNECEEFRNTGLGCQNGATCQNLPGSYNCICPPGWYGLHCTQKTRECKSSSSASICGNGVCIDTTTGIVCQCDQGWTNDKITGTCTVDLDECSGNTNPCSHDPLVKCENLPGSFKCGPCPIGFIGNGYQCRDIDECLSNNGGCSSNPMVQCINTRGSRVCGPCPPGYSGDGVSCSRVDDLCQVNRGGCHPLAQCIQNPGLTYVQCRCPPGWFGSGVGENGCVQDNRTSAQLCPPSYCLNGGTCHVSSDRSILCACPPSFIGPRCEIGSQACASQPCKNNGTCLPIPGVFQSYKCLCAFGYTGDNCQYSILGCGGTIEKAEGTLSWPPLNITDFSAPSIALECRWNIIAPNSSLVLNVTINYNISCSLNTLRIFDSRAMFPGKRFCGLGKRANYTSSRNTILLVYEYNSPYSSELTQLRQFTLNWTSIPRVCGGVIDVSTHGQISSPGSPGHYPHSASCKWTLMTQPGKRIQFTFVSMDIESHSLCKFDFLKIFDGPEITDTPLATLCNKTIPPPITTSSSLATLQFQTDDYITGTGFQLAYIPVEGIPGCGGLLNAPFGRILPPQSHKSDGTYADNLMCEWKIRMPGRDRIKLETKNFKLEYSNGCTYDNLEVYDGPDTNSKLIGRWCGESAPEPLTSSRNSLTIVFNSDASYNEGSFLIDYSTVCDVEFAEPNGTITSPLYPNHYPGDRVCYYLISLPVGNSVTLRILDIDLEHKATLFTDSGEEDSCLYDSLTIYDGDTTNSKVLSELCGNGTVGELISTHNFMLLVFKSDVSGGGRGFAANYTSTPIDCGGIFRSESGTIKSPTEIEPNMKCRWVISAPVGKVIELGWSSFMLEFSTFCLRGNVEIFENNTDIKKARNIGEKYCGDKVPPTMTSTSNILMIVLTTSTYSNTNPKFTAFYRIRSVDEACSGNFLSLNGVIQSPKYPEDYPNGLNCVWTITVPTGKQISLKVKEFLLEGRAPCKSDYLEIRNGGYSTSPLIGKYCGGTISDEITSFGNQLYLKFFSDAAVSSKGFSLTWDGTLTGCGGDLNGYSGSIISPNYPSPYGRNAICIWRITVSQGSLVALTIVDIDLEAHSDCVLDYIEVRDGTSSRSPVLGKYCSTNHPLTISSSGNALHIKFRSDISKEGRGFHLKFTTVCNRTVKGYRGVVESPEFPLGFTMPVDCTWTIEAPMGNTFTVVFSHLTVLANKLFASFCNKDESRHWPMCKQVNNCDTTFIQIDEGTSTSGKALGKFCGTQSLATINSTFNEIKIHMKSMGGVSEVLFRLEWFVVGCGGVIRGKSFGEMSTPNYPDIFSRPVVCEWTIIVDLGSRVSITVSDLAIDKPNDCAQNYVKFFGGPDSSSPPVSTLCKSLDSSEEWDMQTSGNQAFVKLQLNQANKHFRFKATFNQMHSNCGGFFTAPEGSFQSKNFPQNYDRNDDCTYVISVGSAHRINLTFVDFDIDAEDNCNTSYVKVYDGEMGSETDMVPLKTLCGSKIPQPIISSTNKLTVRFNAGLRVAKGFNAKYSPICGSIINVTDDSLLSHTEFYDTNSYQNCTWNLRSGTLGKKLTLTFTKFLIQRSNSENTRRPNEIYCGLKIFGGEDETLQLMALEGDVMPPSIEVPGGRASVKLFACPSMHVSFSLLSSILDNACGGTLEADSGQFASPKYPNDYPPNVECVWTISNSPGNTLNFQIEDMKIESSNSCNENYLEVRRDDEGGSLIGAYCGDILPPRVSTNSSLWVKFRSSTGIDKGFKASYSIGFFNELRGTSGDVDSPRYPSSSIRKGDYKWRITASIRSRISISFNEVYFEGSTTCLDKLTIFDGYDETAHILHEYCGFGDSFNLDELQSTSNVVFIVFHAIAYPARFSLSWKEVSRSKITPSRGSSVNCTQELQIPLGSSVDFTSPGFPNGYAPYLKCEWILVTEPQNHIETSFSTIDLERYTSYSHCSNDRIEVFNGVSDGSWNLMDTLCKKNDTEKSIIGTSMVKVKFSTDIFGNRTGFSATAQSVCGGSLTDPDGVILLNRTGYISTTCTWNITVKPGKRIEITFGSFDFPNSAETTACSSNYLILRDGFEDDAPFVGNGKFCDKNYPKKTLITSSNRLAVVASEDFSYTFRKQQMELRYITKSRTCNTNIQLSPKSLRSIIIRSPNYPNMPPPHSECSWQFFAPNHETIHIEFLDRFDLAYSADCEKEYVELRDGSTELSPLLGRYCYSTPPAFVMTEGNALFVKYFTDMQYPNNGFKAKVSLSDCGGTHHDFYSGSIESPGYPSPYDTNVNCVWRFINPNSDVFKLTTEKFNLGRNMALRTQSAACNSSSMDTLNITVVNRADFSSSETWIVCRSNFSAPSEIPGNELILNFTSVGTRNIFLSNDIGFKINLRSEKTRCGGELNLPSGEIKSPGYPGSIRSNFCNWRITVPQGRRITFNLTDFDLELESMPEHYSSTLSVYNDFQFSSLVAKWNGSVPAGTSVSTSDNKMMIYFSAMYASAKRGFRGFYSSDLPTLCLADGLDQPAGLIRVDIQQAYVCEWEVISKGNNQTTTTFTVLGTVDEKKIDSLHCYRADSNVEFNLNNVMMPEYCSVAEQNSPFVVSSPFPSTSIKVRSEVQKPTSNYTISWVTRKCGGVFNVEGEITIKSPSVGGKYPPNYDCVWKITYPEETTIKVQFNYLDLDMTGSTVNDCSSDYLAIYNGGTPQSPLISKSCGTIVPTMLLTLSNNLWIHFHSDGSNEAKGFGVTLSTDVGACGGIIHENTGTISSVNYPNQYPNRSNCIFEIRVDKGYHIGLNFIERFYIEDSPGCIKDYLEVLDFDETSGSWKSLGKVCGRATPQVFNSTSNKMRVHFKTDDSIQGDGYKARWNVNCGGLFDGSKPGAIHSPQYPRNYDGDLSCNYTVKIQDASKMIFGSFETFELEQRNTQGCAYDYVDIWYYSNKITAASRTSPIYLGRYCGSDPPPRFVSYGTFKVSFVTDRFTEFKGFRLNYGPEECGGNVTQPSVIGNTFTSQKIMSTPSVNCTWRIFAPAGQVVVIKIQELSLSTSSGCNYGSVKIWDGDVILANKTNLMAVLCGTLSDRSGFYRTLSENAIINFYSPAYISNRKVVAEISFALGPKVGCGGRVTLRESMEKILNLSPTKDFASFYGSVECVWTVTAPSSMAVSAEYTKTDVDSCIHRNKSSIVEFYDGIDENSELIARYNCSKIPNIITSSRSVLTIKFFTDGGVTGFSTTVRAFQSPCGIRLLNVTNEVKTLTSPSYPDNYPANIHCSWILTSRNPSFYIHVEQVDIVESPGCANDSLKIRDIGMRFPFTSALMGGGGTNIYVGNSRLNNMKPTMNMGSRNPFSTSIFCGKMLVDVDYYSSSDLVMIKFVSSSAKTSKGFKLTYTSAGCSRNFTSVQGRIKVTNQRKPCIMHVFAPDPKSTISLYFSEIRAYNWPFRSMADKGKQIITIVDGANPNDASKTLLAIKTTGIRTPEPIFSNTSLVTISISPATSPVSFDITYTTTTEGRGCGGYIFNYGGIFTSPLYPMNVRNFTTCKWVVAVPVGGVIELEFTTFDLGPKSTWKTDYVELYDVDPETGEEVLKRTYYGGDTPAKFTGVKGKIAVRYVTSIHNGGTGWVARFMSHSTDPSWPALVGRHLIT